jgi:hypothetical protein
MRRIFRDWCVQMWCIRRKLKEDKMGTGTIALIVKDGMVTAQTKFRDLNQNDISNLITNLEMLKQDFMSLYAKGVNRNFQNK